MARIMHLGAAAALLFAATVVGAADPVPLQCTANQYLDVATNKCISCPAGTFSDAGTQGQDLSACSPCDLGTYRSTSMLACVSCPGEALGDRPVRDASRCVDGDELAVCDAKRKATVSKSSSAALYGPIGVGEDFGIESSSGQEAPEDATQYMDACGTMWGGLTGKRSIKGNIIPRITSFDLCDNVTVSLNGVKAVAVDSFEQPLEGEDAVSGSLVFRQAKQGGLEAAQMATSDVMVSSNRTLGYRAERHTATMRTRKKGTFEDIKSNTYVSAFCSYGSTTLGDSEPGTLDEEPTLSLLYDPEWKTLAARINNPTTKTFTGVVAKLVFSKGTKLPQVIVPRGFKTSLLASPGTADATSGVLDAKLVVLNKGTLPPKSSMVNIVPVELPALPVTITLEVVDKEKTTWTKPLTISA